MKGLYKLQANFFIYVQIYIKLEKDTKVCYNNRCTKISIQEDTL